jgi:EmrB/QacA subfamily drug resistance transporter
MQHDYPRLAEPERRRIVIGALVSMFLAALDQTIVAPSLPTLAVALGHPEWLSWVITVYLLVGTAVTPLYGKIADIKGRRPTLYFGIAVFLVGSVLCGLSTSMPMLIVARAIQGLGGGGLVAVAQTIIADVVPPKERGQYSAYISGLWASASIAGPVLGGVLTQHIHWSAIFWINLPIGALAITLVLRALARLPDTRHPHKLDVLGSGLVGMGTVSILLGLTFGARDGNWGTPSTLTLLVTGVVVWGLFVRHVFRAPEPLVPPRVVMHPVIAAALAAQFFITGANIGLTIYTPAFLQAVHGLAPASTGTAMLAQMVGSVTGSAITGRAMRRDPHYKRYALVGASFAGLIYGAMALGLPSLSFWAVEAGFFLAGVGFSAAFPVMTVSVQNAAERKDLGVATATVAFVRSLGGMGGVAVYGTILLSVGAVMATAGEGGGATVAAPDTMLEGFRIVLAAAMVGEFLAVAFLLKMKELPLRGRAAGAGEA